MAFSPATKAFIHIIDSMFSNSACQMAQGDRATAVAPRHRLAELPARLARLAAGPQRLHPPGPRLPRPRRQQEGRHRAGLPAAGRQLPAVGGRSLPAQPPLRQRDRRRQAPACRNGSPWKQAEVHCTEGIGIWEWAGNDRGRRARCRHGVLRRHPDAGSAGGRVDPARTPARAEDPGGQRGRPDEAAIGQRAPARTAATATTTPCSPPTSTSSSPSTATPA